MIIFIRNSTSQNKILHTHPLPPPQPREREFLSYYLSFALKMSHFTLIECVILLGYGLWGISKRHKNLIQN